MKKYICPYCGELDFTLGTTPYQWLLQQRIVLAQRLLETTNETIERVATRCGFSSAATLRLHFQRLLHVSPQMYRHAFHRENRGERQAGRTQVREPLAVTYAKSIAIPFPRH